MRYALVVVGFACAVALSQWIARRESMQKPRPRHDERMSPSWLNENVYEEGKQS